MSDADDLAFPGMEPPAAAPAYRVLARKYRPASFDTLLGQEAMVQTLGNAIARNRLAQAWLLTGVRGVGKTSTARIIAKALNCVGPDGQGGPTITPCGVCEPCVAIAEGRSIDVIEQDAASNTKVEQMRELLDGVPYATASSRFRIYILDEVHQLSSHSFNALLKTLEEPPPHVKFIFATTEVQKVPLTVLSRCQRFDLRRVPADTLAKHFSDIVKLEGAQAEEEAMALIARAAEGSVRDGLSILDQAIAHSAGTITADAIRDMLGLADRGAVRQLFGLALVGDAAGTLAAVGQQYDLGLDPEMLLRALLELVHAITRQRLAPADDPALSVEERALLADWAQRLSFPALHRLWQLLLKGLAEVQAAPVPLQAAEMALLRLIHASELPDPGDLLRRLSAGGAAAAPAPALLAPAAALATAPVAFAAPPPPTPPTVVAPSATPAPADFPALVALFRSHNEARLHHMLTDDLHLVAYTPPLLTVAASPRLPRDQLALIAKRLNEWTGAEWRVDFVESGGAPTLREAELADSAARIATARADPAVAALLDAFPEAEIIGFDPDERIPHAQSR